MSPLISPNSPSMLRDSRCLPAAWMPASCGVIQRAAGDSAADSLL